MGTGASRPKRLGDGSGKKTHEQANVGVESRDQSSGDANSLNCFQIVEKQDEGRNNTSPAIKENESGGKDVLQEEQTEKPSLLLRGIQAVTSPAMLGSQGGTQPQTSNSFCVFYESDGENTSTENMCFSHSAVTSHCSCGSPHKGHVRSDESILRELRSEGMLLAVKGARTKSWDRRGQQIIRELKDTGLLGKMEAENLIAQEKHAMPRRLCGLQRNDSEGSSPDEKTSREYDITGPPAASVAGGEETPDIPHPHNPDNHSTQNEALAAPCFRKPLPPITRTNSGNSREVIRILENLELL